MFSHNNYNLKNLFKKIRSVILFLMNVLFTKSFSAITLNSGCSIPPDPSKTADLKGIIWFEKIYFVAFQCECYAFFYKTLKQLSIYLCT